VRTVENKTSPLVPKESRAGWLDGLFSVADSELPVAGSIDFYTKLHVFRVHRRLLRYYTTPFFVLFAVVDFFYAPDKAPLWLLLRLSVLVATWALFAIMVRFGWARRKIKVWTVLWTYVAVVLSPMIYATGGGSSPYLGGALSCSVCIVLMFNFSRAWAIASQVLFMIPISIAILLKDGETNFPTAVTAIACFSAIVILAAIGSSSGEQLNRVWRRAQKRTRSELERGRRSEFLKSHFPPALREEIESGRLVLGRRTVVPNAVVGFADLIGSTKIGNTVDLETDWKLKETFLTAATVRATECGMVVLNQMGDGFFFVANFGNVEGWEKNLLVFYERVTADLQQILMSLRAEIGEIDSGIRFGVSKGPVMLGLIGTGGQSYFTAMGAEVNLAARLCAAAGPNEMVVSSIVGHYMQTVLVGRETESRIHSNLKGFSSGVPTIHIKAKAAALYGADDAELNKLIEELFLKNNMKAAS
jgi:class 3 adenylate cyclase